MNSSDLKRWVRRLAANAGSAALALLLALVLWVIAVQQENPLQRGELSAPLRVSAANVPPGLVLFGDINAQVRVWVRAPRRTWETLRPDSFTAFVDLSNAGPGIQDVPVQIVHPDPDVVVLDKQPARVRVRLEHVLTKTLTVRADVLDSVPFGYEWSSPIITPTTVTITGAAPYVQQVASAVVEIYLRGAKQTFSKEQTVSLRDAAGDPAGFVELVPRVVSVTVPIVQRAGFRDVPVRVRWQGQPAPGYRISNVTVDPQIVTIFGSPADIESIPGFVETLPVVVEGANADVVERLPLTLPESVSVFGVQAVQVRISITPIEGGLTVERAPVIQGLTPGLTAHVSPETVDVIIAGPLPRLDSLRVADVRVVLDLSGLPVGTYTITPTVVLPEGIRMESMIPGTVEVDIELSTSTPTSTPTRTPTPTSTPTPTPTATETPTATPAPRRRG